MTGRRNTVANTELSELDMGGKRMRPYQVRLVETVREMVRQGRRRVIINSPTGSGKTVMACCLIKLSALKNKRSMFLAPRRELLKQASAHLEFCGVRHSFIAAGFDQIAGSDCLVVSKDTLATRTIRKRKMELPDVDLVIVDEVHLAMAQEYLRLLTKMNEENPRLVMIGLSATPGRADGKGLGDFWDSITTAAGYSELQEMGFLVPCRVFAPSAPDMKGVRSVDWDSEAAARVDKPKLVGDVVEHWQRYASDRQTIVFGATIAHSIHLRDEFRKAGVRAEQIDQSTPAEERDSIIGLLQSGDVQVVTNCDVLSFGFDEPLVSCVVLVAPSRSLVRYRQRSGRALRPAPSKRDCLILDHAGGVLMHGFPDEDIDWPLEKSRNIDQEYQAKRAEGKTREPIVCPNCHCTYSGKPACPNCGNKLGRSGRKIAIQKGLLKEVKREKKDRVFETLESQQKLWHQCLAMAANKGLHCGAAAAMFAKHAHVAPWQVDGLSNVPRAYQMKDSAADVFPQYVRRRVGSR